MKRLCLLLLLGVVLVGGAFAQIQFIGDDFENLIDGMGKEILPHLEQLAVWGQFPGHATYAEKTGFFMTVSTGAVLSNGIFRFADDPGSFQVLNVPNLLDAALATNAAAQGFANFAQTFFPYPILRLAMGFVLPYEIEAMFDLTGFPQLITGFAGGLAGLDSLKLSSLHVSAKVRKAITKDAGPFPGISIGAGYGYSGMTFGIDIGKLADIDSDGYGEVGVGIGDLNLKGDLFVQGWVHSFGIDVQTSKAFGVLVPFLGLSSYYHIAQFGGRMGTASTFEAYLDTNGDDIPEDTYIGPHPETAWIDNDLSMVLFGGIDFDFGRFALQLHSSWNIMKSWPGVTLGARWQ